MIVREIFQVIDALDGAIIGLSQAHRICVPANEVLYSMIKYLESQLHLPFG
jgi:ketopantoate reductase